MAAKHPKIADAAKKAGADIILVQSARSLDKMGQPNSRILAVTDSYLPLYTTPKYSEAKFYWIDTDSYSFSGRAIEMRFGSEDVITFEPEDPTPVHCLILNLLEGCLPPADSVKLQLAQYDHHARPIGGTGLIGPYKALVSKMQKPVTNDNVTRALHALAEGRASTFNPARSPVKGKNNKWEQVAAPVYETLSIVPFLESLVVGAKTEKGDAHGDLGKFLPRFGTLKYLDIKNIDPKKFKDVCDGLKKTNFNSIAVKGEFKKDHFEPLKAAATAIDLQGLCLKRPFRQNDSLLRKFYTDVLIPLAGSLMILVLEDMKGMQFDELPALLPNLVVLGLINCGLDVAETLNRVSVMTKLRILSLTKNIAFADDDIRSVPGQLAAQDGDPQARHQHGASDDDAKKPGALRGSRSVPDAWRAQVSGSRPLVKGQGTPARVFNEDDHPPSKKQTAQEMFPGRGADDQDDDPRRNKGNSPRKFGGYFGDGLNDDPRAKRRTPAQNPWKAAGAPPAIQPAKRLLSDNGHPRAIRQIRQVRPAGCGGDDQDDDSLAKRRISRHTLHGGSNDKHSGDPGAKRQISPRAFDSYGDCDPRARTRLLQRRFSRDQDDTPGSKRLISQRRFHGHGGDEQDDGQLAKRQISRMLFPGDGSDGPARKAAEYDDSDEAPARRPVAQTTTISVPPRRVLARDRT